MSKNKKKSKQKKMKLVTLKKRDIKAAIYDAGGYELNMFELIGHSKEGPQGSTGYKATCEINGWAAEAYGDTKKEALSSLLNAVLVAGNASTSVEPPEEPAEQPADSEGLATGGIVPSGRTFERDPDEVLVPLGTARPIRDLDQA